MTDMNSTNSLAELPPRKEVAAPVLEVKGLNLSVAGLYAHPLVQNIGFSIARGEAMALVGESGCGKSITCWSCIGLPPKGVQMDAEVLRLNGENLLKNAQIDAAKFKPIRGKRMSMIFQDPIASLNPIRRVGTFLIDLLMFHQGLDRAGSKAEAIRLLDAVGIPNAKQKMQSYPHELSGGQSQRVMIAGALTGEPELLIADEPTTALDVTTQAQIMNLLTDLRRDRAMGLLIVSHDLGVIAESADKVAVMYAGRIVESGPVADVFQNPSHPYTNGLLRSVPPDTGRAALTPIPGNVPPLSALPKGCAFAERCERPAEGKCYESVPDLTEVDNRRIACWQPMSGQTT